MLIIELLITSLFYVPLINIVLNSILGKELKIDLYKDQIILLLIFILVRLLISGDKDAGSFAFERGLDPRSTFFIYSILLFPFFEIFDDYRVVWGLNISISTAIITWAMRLCSNGKLSILLLPLYIYIFYWGLWGLRDPLILLSSMMIFLSIANKKYLEFFLFSIIIFFTRPEFSFLIIFAVIYGLKNHFIKLTIFLFCTSLLTIFAFQYIIFLFKVDAGALNFAEFYETFSANRYIRGQDDSTAMLKYQYLLLDPVPRFFLTFFSIFIFPTYVDWQFFTFIFGVMNLYLVILIFSQLVNKSNESSIFFVFLFFLSMLLLTLFAHNYGNIFRLKLAFLSLIILAQNKVNSNVINHSNK